MKIKKEKSYNMSYNKSSAKNETTKRLNFEDLDDLSNQNNQKNKRSQREKIKERLNHKTSIKENSNIKRSQIKRNQTSNSKNEERKTSEISSPLKEDHSIKIYNSKVNNGSSNITPVKISKANYNSNSKNISGEKLSNSPMSKKGEKNIRKKNSFDFIQDSIRLKKSRSMSSGSGTRSSTKNSVESEEEVFHKTRHSPRLQKKSLKLRKINEESKSIYKNKKQKIHLKSKKKAISTLNRELKSLDKVDISANTPRDRTPEKFKSPLKNSVLTGSKTKDINTSSRKNSAKKEKKDKIKFGTSIYIKEFDPKTPVKSLSYNLKNSPRLKNNLLNKKSNLKKTILTNEKNEIKNTRSVSRTNSPLSSSKKRKISQ